MVWPKKIDENSKTRFWKVLLEHRSALRQPIPKKASNGWAQFSDFVLDRNHSKPPASPSFQASSSESSPQPVFKPISNSSSKEPPKHLPKTIPVKPLPKPQTDVLWFVEKKNKKANTGFEKTLLKNQKTSNLQNNDFLAEINESKNQQENSYSRVDALKEATIQIQNELKGTKALEKTELLYPKKQKSPKSNRVKILEEYLKKT